MNYQDAIEKLRGYDQQARDDLESGLEYMAEYRDMCISLTAQTFGVTEDQVKADMKNLSEKLGSQSLRKKPASSSDEP